MFNKYIKLLGFLVYYNNSSIDKNLNKMQSLINIKILNFLIYYNNKILIKIKLIKLID